MKHSILIFFISLVILGGCIKKVDRDKPKDKPSNSCEEKIDNTIHISATKAYNDGDYYKALYLYKKSCEIKYIPSCNYLAYFHYSGKVVEKDLKKAFNIYFQSCKSGDSVGCFNTANMLRAGEGLEKKNEELAVTLYKSNCKNDHYKSCFNLGVMYHKGKGVEKDIKKSKLYFQKACGGGIGLACKNFYLIENKNIKYLPNL